jgi:hypothetical protein
MLEEQKGNVGIESMMRILRHHNVECFDPQTSITNVDVCMHASFGPIRGSQSTASMVVYLDANAPLIFATGTSAPCTGIFKPMWLDASSGFLSALGPEPASTYDSSSLFWSHERLHRSTLLNYPERIKTYAGDRDMLEKKFVQGALNLSKASVAERAEFSTHCFHQAAQAEADWLKRVEQVPARRKVFHASAWNGFNNKAEMPEIR